MRPYRSLALSLVLGALFAPPAKAQLNVARFTPGKNWIYSSYGLDPAFVLTAGYARAVPVFGHAFQLGIDGGVVAARLDARDFRGRVQARTSLLHWRSLRLTGSAAFLTRGTTNSVYRGLTFASDFAGTAGVYRKAWFLAGEFGFDKDIITHVTNSDWYRSYFYPDAKDGWYLNAGGTFHYGVATGVAFGPAELSLRAGYLRTETFDTTIPPLYASLGLGIGF